MGWDKTRYCACNECRFHAQTEPGWEKCPVPVTSKEYANGRWLWIRSLFSAVDLEKSDEVYLKEQRSQQVYEDVSSG